MNILIAIFILCGCMVFVAKCFWMAVEWRQERKWRQMTEAERIRKTQQDYRDFLDRAP